MHTMPSITLLNSLSTFAAIFYNVGHKGTLTTFFMKQPLKKECRLIIMGFIAFYPTYGLAPPKLMCHHLTLAFCRMWLRRLSR